MRPRPYIGITGFTTRTDVDAIASAHTSSSHLLMVGVLVSDKSMAGASTKWPRRYPAPADVGAIFGNHANVLNLVHFHTSTTAAADLAKDMLAVAAIGGEHFHGFQLNVRWPDPNALVKYHLARKRQMRRHLDAIVLQCGTGAMEEVKNDPRALAKRVKDYDGLVDYVLIDPSGGKGKECDQAFAAECFLAIGSISQRLRVGVAGGLSATTLGQISTLCTRHSGFCIDAEGKLRDANDDLDTAAAIAYLQAAAPLMKA